jgi:hypothetical protein
MKLPRPKPTSALSRWTMLLGCLGRVANVVQFVPLAQYRLVSHGVASWRALCGA